MYDEPTSQSVYLNTITSIANSASLTFLVPFATRRLWPSGEYFGSPRSGMIRAAYRSMVCACGVHREAALAEYTPKRVNWSVSVLVMAARRKVSNTVGSSAPARYENGPECPILGAAGRGQARPSAVTVPLFPG